MNPVTVLDYWRVTWRARLWILSLTVVATVVAYGVTRLQPKVYTARATILTPRASGPTSMSASIGSILGNLGGGREGGGGGFSLPAVSMGLPAVSTNEDMFVALLKSRTMREEVLAEFAGAWGPSAGSMVVSVEPNTKDKGIIALTVEATDSKLAADVANYYFERMRLRLQRNAERAVQGREQVYRSQLERASKEISAAEEALLKFQSENRMLATIDPSTKASVEGAVNLRGAIMALEMQRELMRMRLTEQHPQMRELEKQISELKKQYSRNLFGGAMDLPPESPNARGARKEFFVAAAKMTPVQFAFLKLFRNLKIQEAFYTAALQGLEQIKYGDGMSPVDVEVLDPAIIPTTYSRPNISLTVAAAAVSALVAGIMLAFVLEYLARVRVELRQASVRLGRAGDGLESHEVPSREAARIGPASSRLVSPYAGGSSSARATTGPGPAR